MSVLSREVVLCCVVLEHQRTYEKAERASKLRKMKENRGVTSFCWLNGEGHPN